MNDAYSYYGDTITSVAGADLVAQIESDIGKSLVVAKQITMISASAFTFKLNSDTWVNTVYEDVDTRHKVSLTDVRLSNLVIIENAIDIFIAILF